MREPSTEEKLVAKGLQAGSSAKNDHRPKSQEVIVIKEHRRPETTDKVYTGDTTVTLSVKNESGAKIAQDTILDRVENVK